MAATRSERQFDGTLGPELSSVLKDDAVRLFDRLRSARTDLGRLVQSPSLTTRGSVERALITAYVRHLLDLVDLPLKQGVGDTAADIWNYWLNREAAFRQMCTTGSEIASYLSLPGSKTEIAEKAKKEIASQLPGEVVLASVPILNGFFAVRGAPIKMRPIAVRALQMKIDKRWSLPRITREVCPCGKPLHGEKCNQVVRQSMLSLKKLLVRCGVDLPALGPMGAL